MKKYLFAIILALNVVVGNSQVTRGYWEVVQVYYYNNKEEVNSEFIGKPIMIQTVSGYMTLTAYVCFSNYGNLILNWSGSTNEGYSIYKDPNSHLYTQSSNPHYLINAFTKIIYASPMVDRIFVATSIDYETYLDKVFYENKKQPYTPHGGYDKNNDKPRSTTQKNSKACNLCNGTGQYVKGSSPNYTGNSQKKWCNICQAEKYPHYHDKCPSCNGTGLR